MKRLFKSDFYFDLPEEQIAQVETQYYQCFKQKTIRFFQSSISDFYNKKERYTMKKKFVMNEVVKKVTTQQAYDEFIKSRIV